MGVVVRKMNRDVLPADSMEEVDAHCRALADVDREFLKRIREAIPAAKAADLASFEGVIPFGDLLRALEKQGVKNVIRRIKRSRAFANKGRGPTAFFHDYCSDLVETATRKELEEH